MKLKKQNKKYTVIAAILVAVFILFNPSKISAPTLLNSIKHNQSKQAITKPSFDKSKYSINDPASVWVVVNKGRILPADYSPKDLVVPNITLRYSAGSSEMLLRADAAVALESMVNQAKTEGINIMLASGYRSYGTQSSVYRSYVNSQGQAEADTFSARPGHSEHQTGLAADLEPVNKKCELDVCFKDTPEGVWLAANAYKYGFITRYPEGKDNITGYEFEPWHVRYVGGDLAKQLHDYGQTMEQFFGLQLYNDYPSESYQLTPGA